MPPVEQRIVLAVGLPGCGKSTWFERRGILPLSSDHLRELLADDVNEQSFQVEIFEALQHLLEMRLRIGRPASYVDATNLRAMHRTAYLEMALRAGCAAEALFFDVPLDVCLERNRGRARQVPEEVMREMASTMEEPTLAEGFRRVIRIGPEGREIHETPVG